MSFQYAFLDEEEDLIEWHDTWPEEFEGLIPKAIKVTCVVTFYDSNMQRGVDKRIEKKIGRKPSFLYGPRLIDIDILYYGNEIINQKGLVIPHEKITERAFVLVPLAEITENFIHPGTDCSINDLVSAIDTSGLIIYEGNQDHEHD